MTTGYIHEIKKLVFYFPVRFMISAFFFAYVLLNNQFFQTIENQILLGLFDFFHVPSYLDGGILFVGNIYSPIQFSIPMQTQILFLIFFPSLAVSTRAAIKTRMKVLLFWPVCMIGLVLIQFLVIVTMMATGFTSSVAVLQASIVCTGIAGSLLIEAFLFLTINLPTRAKLGTKIKRSHFDEYVIVGVLLSGAVILVYLVTNILNLQSNSPVTAYLAINLSSILLLRYYLAYFIYEIKVPKWAKSNQITVVRQNYDDTPLSFLLPAYNEEKHIRRCIESIDKAAANYLGNTEIVVVNDVSTDDTRKIASEAVLNLKHASGKVYNIPNSGKGHALQYGLDRISGDIVFRIDTDSAIDKHAITRVMCHFKDPDVGSVSGLILPLEEKSWIQKIWVLRYALLTFYKREWELIDAALVQPGAFSVFRRDALVNVGGWADDILGEDGDITIKLARCGYRNQYEQHAIVFSDIPSNLKDLREQRVRWSMSFYHARATNLDVIKEADGPISIMYALSILDVGSNYAAALYLPFLIATLITGHESFLNLGILLGVPVGLLTIEFLTYGLQTLVHVYFLFKFKKLYILKYIPASRFYDFIYTVFIAPEALEILLSVSSKWKAKHTKDLTKALRKKIKEGIGST